MIVHPDMQARVPAATVPIVTTEPYAGWARVAALFHPVPPVTPGIHPTAFVAESAKVDPTAEVGPLSIIEAAAEIGPRCRIGPSAVIGSGVVVGRDCRIGAHVTLSHALLGERVCIHPGARIGQEGFRFASVKSGFLTVPQLGRAIIEDDVEVGANTTIDRGSARDTIIGAGSRLDNLVQIGHNVMLGRCCVIVAQVGISGSTVLGDFVRVGGQAAMAGHLQHRARCADWSTGWRHFGFAVRRDRSWKSSTTKAGLFSAGGHAQAVGTKKKEVKLLFANGGNGRLA